MARWRLLPAIWVSRAVWPSLPTGRCLSAIAPERFFKVDREGRAEAFASLPASVAAFHLALAPDGVLYVSAPTLSTYDAIYRIAPDGTVERSATSDSAVPRGSRFDAHGALFVVEALAGSSGLYRLSSAGAPELVLAGPSLIGVAFDPRGGYVVCSNDTAYRLPRSV